MLLLNVVAFLAIPFLAFAKIIMGPFQYSQGTFTVSWTAASDAPPSFDILLRKGAQRIPLVQQIPSSLGTYSYAIPSTTPPGDNYKVQFVVHDPSNPSPEILDTSPAFVVAQTDFSQTGSAASSATASVSSVSGSSASLVSGSSVTASQISSLQSSVSTALASLTPGLSSGIVTTVTSGSVIYTTTINPVSATVSAISQSIASATSSAAAAASSSVRPSSAGALGFSRAGILFSVAGAILGAVVVF